MRYTVLRRILLVSKKRFILVYRPPSSSSKKELLIKKTNAFVELMSLLVNPHVTIFIMGDLNLPKINWSASSSDKLLMMEFTMLAIFNFLCSHGFTQFVTEPTRFKHELATETDVLEGNILDIILSTDHLSINIDQMLPPISTSDHCQIDFSIFSPINLLNALVIDHDPSADDNIYDKLNELQLLTGIWQILGRWLK